MNMLPVGLVAVIGNLSLIHVWKGVMYHLSVVYFVVSRFLFRGMLLSSSLYTATVLINKTDTIDAATRVLLYNQLH